MKKKLKYLIIFSIIIAIIGFIGINNIAPYAVIMPPRVHENTTPADLGLESENIEISLEDTVKMKGYWIESKQDTAKGILVLLHGIGGCKEHYLNLCKELSEKGIITVIYDGRAHGVSGGEYCTFGYKEKEDISKLLDFIKEKEPNLPLGIWGNSLGGAIAIQALEHDKRIEFGIIESTFAELKEIVYQYQKRLSKGIGMRWVSNHVLKRAGEIGGFDPEKVRPIESVKNIEQPMFISHGDADENINFKFGKALFDNLKSKDKEFVKVEGAGHNNLFVIGGEEYKNKLMKFISRHFERNIN